MTLSNIEEQVLDDLQHELKIDIQDKNSVRSAKFSHFIQKDGYIEKLNLTALGSKEREEISLLPESIGALSKLKILDINEFALGGLPESIGNLKELRRFRFYGRGIQNIETIIECLPESIGNWTKLNELTISSVNLKYLPESIRNFKELKIFRINNTLLDALPISIGSWTKLEDLNISHMKIRKLPEVVGNFKNLTKFYLDYTLCDELPISIKNWVSLQFALIENNQFTEIPTGIFNWNLIQSLKFNHNPLNKNDEQIKDEARIFSNKDFSTINGEGLLYLRKRMYKRAKSLYPESNKGFQIPHWKDLERIFGNEEYFDNRFQRLLDDDDETRLVNLGALLIKYKMYDKAEQIFKKLMTGNRRGGAITRLQMIERLRWTPEKQEEYWETQLPGFISYGLDKHILKEELGLLKYKMKKYKEAIDFLENGLDTKPNTVGMWYILGKAYLKLGKKEEAIKYLEMVRDPILDLKIFDRSLKKIENLILTAKNID